MEAFIIILSLVWSVLCIVLFFKVWGMTDDVKAIRELLATGNATSLASSVNQPQEGDASATDAEQSIKFNNDRYAPGSLVVERSTERQMRIKEVTPEGKYKCYINNLTNYIGEFTKDEIEPFQDYVSRINK